MDNTFLLNYKERSKKLLVPSVASVNKSLSPEERRLVDADLYGANEVVEETDEFIECKLSELQREIELLDDDLTSAYHQAVAIEKQTCDNEESSYVSGRKFALMFLRSDCFNAQDAARRLTKHFREKLEIFGREKLASRIKQADLNNEDNALLESGFLIITGATDDYGRVIIFRRQQVLFRMYQSAKSAKRVIYYILQHAVEEYEMSQKTGFVVVDYSMGTKNAMPASAIQKLYPCVRLINRALPIRFAAIHVCYDRLMEHFFFNLLFLLLPQYMKARTQCHHEKAPIQCLSELQAYGIDPNILPLTEDGEFRYDMLKEWLERQRRSEEQSSFESEELLGQHKTFNDLAADAQDINLNGLPDTEVGKVQGDDPVVERKRPSEHENQAQKKINSTEKY